MHLGHAAGRVAGDLPQEPAQGLVRECERGQPQRRQRSDLQSQAAAALAARHAGVRLFAGLSLPRPARPDAHASDRHRAVPLRRDEAERDHQAGQESRLLEKGPALSRRHRIRHHPQSFDRRPRLRDRQGRHDLPDRGHGRAAKGHQGASPQCGLRPGADQRQHQSHHQPRCAALRQSRPAQRHGDGARPQGFRRHPVPGTGRHRRRAAAPSGGRLGAAARYPEIHSGLRARRAEEPRRGPQADGEGRLRPRQAAQDQGVHPQPRGLSRSRRHRHRSAQGHLHRCRARDRRVGRVVRQDRPQGLFGGRQPDRQRHR